MSLDEKKRFQDDAKGLKGFSITEDPELQKIIDERPKKPMNAFLCFSKVERAKIKSSGEQLSASQITARLKEAWETIPPEAQLPFLCQENDLLQQYQAADIAWLKKYSNDMKRIEAYMAEQRGAKKKQKEARKRATAEKLSAKEKKDAKRRSKDEKKEKKRQRATGETATNEGKKKKESPAPPPPIASPIAKKSTKIDYSVLEKLLAGDGDSQDGATGLALKKRGISEPVDDAKVNNDESSKQKKKKKKKKTSSSEKHH